MVIDNIVLSLVTRVEAGDGDALLEFHRASVAGNFTLAAGEREDIAFQLSVPWETPVTHLQGRRLAGMTMGVRTELSVAKAVDQGDLDEVEIHPLPVQEQILAAFDRLGFRLRHADLERGGIYGVRQELPFYQEIEFAAPPEYAKSMDEVEVTFVADATGTEVILEFDKRGGLLAEGRDTYARYRVEHTDAQTADWTSSVQKWIHQAVTSHSASP
ncbi:sporulation-control protein [Actinoplanes digitatis]|uniref:Sporulation-control protein n=1 Tax=Actinoplanes digitatis TaxID=1868 RepID=A0A7W7HTF3_9ACTN|nr:sporulation-control protein [Actinoplanes digitatis]